MKNRIDEDYMYESKRLVEISDALRILQKKSLTYLKDYEKSLEWKTFKHGFLSNNVQINPKDITNIEICALGNDKEVGFVSPESKKITICSNKIMNYEHFQKIMTYNLTMIYDMFRANIDYAKCEQLACMQIRALTISKICKKTDSRCYKYDLKETLFQKEICQGKFDEVYDKVFHSCSTDFAPFNQIRHQKGFLNF